MCVYNYTYIPNSVASVRPLNCVSTFEPAGGSPKKKYIGAKGLDVFFDFLFK